MSDIGIKGLVSKNINEIKDLVKLFIKSSLNIRDGIICGGDPEICMLSLIRDTYTCNLILRYVGLMTLVTIDPEWTTIDTKLLEYVQIYHTSEKFKNKLIELYEHFLRIFEKTKKNYDYCKFLDKMISRGEITKTGTELKNVTKMFENKIFSSININPIIKINKKYFKVVPSCFEIVDDKAIVHLTQSNFLMLLDTIDDPLVLSQLEDQHMGRSNSILSDFSKLIVARQMLASEAGHDTFFKYVNRGKSDNSDTIKYFLDELNEKLDPKLKPDLMRIRHNFCINTDNTTRKMKRSDIVKYVRSRKNNTRFDPSHVVSIIFEVLKGYFNITVKKIDEKGWNQNVLVYELWDTKLLGRLFMDTNFDENKQISDPISIRLADKMQINTINGSVAEVALIANYLPFKNPTSTIKGGITYNEIVLLFREFGYIVSNMCYESRVGLINYDDEFANYMPSLMECIAWDYDIIRSIVKGMDPSIADHIEMDRNIDMCYNIKLKCANAKFDHLIHNSEPLIRIITKALDTKGNATNELIETYKDIFIGVMKPVSDILETNISTIDPNVMVQEINSSQGLLYSNLMNEIFAYATFWIIKNDTNMTHVFRKTLLDNGVDNYRELIRMFLRNSEINCFNLYMTNVLKIDMFDETLTEDPNYFEEDHEENHEENIIQFNRV